MDDEKLVFSGTDEITVTYSFTVEGGVGEDLWVLTCHNCNKFYTAKEPNFCTTYEFAERRVSINTKSTFCKDCEP